MDDPKTKRNELLNKFVSCGQEVTSFVSKYIEFLELRHMVFNETEREDIEDITDNLGIALGALEEAWDKVYAFQFRVTAEENLKDAIDRS